MSTPSSPTPQRGSVRNMISIFENQTITVENEPVVLLRRAKSMQTLSQNKPVVVNKSVNSITVQRSFESQVSGQNLELTQIEHQILHLQNNLNNNYKSYSRENHIYYQNQIIFILTDLGSVETRNNDRMADMKSELTEALKRLNKKLNALLPATGVVPVQQYVQYDKFGVKSNSFEEEPREIKKKEVVKQKTREIKVVQRQEAVVVKRKEPEVKKIVEVVNRREETEEEEEEEVDSPSVSVRTLKQLFEKNANSMDAQNELGATKISRKFLTFNSTADLKYVPYSQKYKSSDAEFNNREEKKIFDAESPFMNGSDEEEVVENFTPDSLSDESSSDGSESEETVREVGEE